MRKICTSLVVLLGILPACSSSDSAPAGDAPADAGVEASDDSASGDGASDAIDEGDAAAAALCAGVTAPCTAFVAGTPESDVADAVATAQAGSTFVFGAGTFAFTNTLTFAAKNVTLRGAGMDATVLDFKGLVTGSSGNGVDVLDGSDGFTIEDIAVRDSRKNGVKVKGSTGVTFRRVKVSWTDPDAKTHGDYAVYPVFCKKVLVEGCDISGSSDAGIYVGQSQTIIVRDNVSHDNVAGIEIENSFDADVFGNTAKNNTGGLVVFDLPGAGNQHDGHNVHVHDNVIEANNTKNFNATGSTVAKIPAGTGTFVLATRDVEIDHNTYKDNLTDAFSVISYYVPDPSWTSTQDPAYYPISKRVHFHDNVLAGNGKTPDLATQLGLLLATGMSKYPNAHVPEILVDGVVDAANAVDGAPVGNPMYVCVHGNGTVDFANLHLDQLDANGTNLGQVITFDGSAYDCTLPALPTVSF